MVYLPNMDQIFAIRKIQAENLKHKKKTYLLFIDFTQAYDKVDRAPVRSAIRTECTR